MIGFEPIQPKQQIYSLPRLSNFGASPPFITPCKPWLKKSQWRDSNPRPTDYKSVALANWATLAVFVLYTTLKQQFPSRFSIWKGHKSSSALPKRTANIMKMYEVETLFRKKIWAKDKSMNNKLISFLDELPYGLILNAQCFGAHKSE